MTATDIKNLLADIVPNAHVIIKEKQCLGSSYIAIHIAASDYLINDVRGQFPAHVSLSFDPKTLELGVQIFGGMGGQSIYRNIDPTIDKERHNVLGRIRLPFRRPMANPEAIKRAISKFAENWKKAIKDNMELMRFIDKVDYEKAIS